MSSPSCQSQCLRMQLLSQLSPWPSTKARTSSVIARVASPPPSLNLSPLYFSWLTPTTTIEDTPLTSIKTIPVPPRPPNQIPPILLQALELLPDVDRRGGLADVFGGDGKGGGGEGDEGLIGKGGWSMGGGERGAISSIVTSMMITMGRRGKDSAN